MSGFGALVTSNNYVVTGLSVANGLAAVVVLAIAVSILIRARTSALTLAFSAGTAAAAAWLICFAFMFSARSAQIAITWARLSAIPIGLIAATALHLTVWNVRPQRRWIAVLSWVVLPLAGVVAAAMPIFVGGVQYRSWGYYPIATPLTAVLVGSCATLMLPPIVLFWRASRRSHGPAQESAHALMQACVLGMLAFIDYLPAAGFGIYPIGYMAVVAFAIVGGSALARHHMIDLTPEYAASQMLETMKSAVLLVGMDARIHVANRAACAMLGYTQGELVGAPIRKLLDNGDPNASSGKILTSTGVLEQMTAWRRADGSRLDVLASSSFVRDSDGAPMGVVYVGTDYTERRRADEAVRESEHRYRTLFDLNPLPMWVYDFETLKFIAVNDEAVRHYGYTREEFLGMHITDIRPDEDVPSVLALLPQLPERVGPAIFRHKKKDGTLINVEVSSFEFISGGRKRRLVMASDITERHAAERLLRESEARYRLLFERNLAGVYRSDVHGRILDCNDACARIFGCESRQEMMALDAHSLYFDRADRDRMIAQLRELRALTNHELRLRRCDGSAVWVLENMTMLSGSEEGVIQGTIIDITDRKTRQEEIEYQAYHDLLTGLPNRLLFRDRISMALAHARRSTRGVAIMFLDIDDFKNVNDSLGHNVGDRLLQAVALRLVGSVRAEDTVARMGGDEFTVLLSDVTDGRSAATVARKILDTIAKPVLVDGHELNVTTSLGIAIFPGDGFDAETLLKNADRAMYRAKQLGRNNYQYATTPPLDDRLILERRLSQAIERNELILHYQPIVEIASGTVVGAEALVRWNDPTRGMLPPESFIPAAEESDLIITIGEWVLRTGCSQMKLWHDGGFGRLRLAINLSPRQFQQRDLASRVARVLEETQFPGNCLELEITESTVMANAEVSLATMMALKSMGVRISIDDFGTGYSSLSYLKRFPIDTLKIDQEFVRDLSADINDQAIITAVVSMARALKLRVVAEGVETEAQLGFLQKEECAEMQGFLYSRPVGAVEFEASLRRKSPAPTRQPGVPI
ncbi:MAG TPA: EAL domain-containing protein [Thermoanaerobaculia bacterium]|nr:EAL domain-containing protein [Thermoanaerobaculia bacterium]